MIDLDVFAMATEEFGRGPSVLQHPCYSSKFSYLPLKFDGQLGEERER